MIKVPNRNLRLVLIDENSLKSFKNYFIINGDFIRQIQKEL